MFQVLWANGLWGLIMQVCILYGVQSTNPFQSAMPAQCAPLQMEKIAELSANTEDRGETQRWHLHLVVRRQTEIVPVRKCAPLGVHFFTFNNIEYLPPR